MNEDGNGDKRPLDINRDDVTIRTATVSIKVLQMGKRQLTLSHFRQIPDWELVNEAEVELDGLPWGWVNYRWGDIDPEATHFVLQRGERLYRNPFLVRGSYEFDEKKLRPYGFDLILERLQALTESLHNARVLEGWRPESGGRWREPYRPKRLPKDIKIDHRPSDFEILHDIETEQRYGSHDSMKGLRDDATQRLRSGIEKRIGRLATAKELEPMLRDVEEVAADYCRRWDSLMSELRKVEQLFIAV